LRKIKIFLGMSKPKIYFWDKFLESGNPFLKPSFNQTIDFYEYNSFFSDIFTHRKDILIEEFENFEPLEEYSIFSQNSVIQKISKQISKPQNEYFFFFVYEEIFGDGLLGLLSKNKSISEIIVEG
jgi:uncharacterized LabA/DUF88 family protein